MKEIKERFSRWFNRRRGRRGTLWMDGFKSVLVEGKGEALRTMAAYIDLNPVRADLVQDPKDYRWCGYAEALGGSRRAQRGLCTALGKPVDGWKSAGAAEACRCLLHTDGREVKDVQNENVVRHGVSVESARAVLKERGKLSTAEQLEAIASVQNPLRPESREPRAVKRRPKTFLLLTEPRQKFHEIPHRDRYRLVA